MMTKLVDDSFLDTAGDPNAPAVVLLHGLTVNRKMWQPCLNRLSNEFYVLAPDLPAHGARRKEKFTLEAATEVVLKLIEEIPSGQTWLAGDTLGAYVAIQVASQRPEAVKGMVLSGCTLALAATQAKGCTAGLTRLMFRFYGTKRLQEATAKNFRDVYPKAPVNEIVQAGLNISSRLDALADLGGRSFPDLLSRYPGPVLLVAGEKDAANNPSVADLEKAALQGQFKLMPGLGQSIGLQNPEGFADLVREFITTGQLAKAAE